MLSSNLWTLHINDMATAGREARRRRNTRKAGGKLFLSLLALSPLTTPAVALSAELSIEKNPQIPVLSPPLIPGGSHNPSLDLHSRELDFVSPRSKATQDSRWILGANGSVCSGCGMSFIMAPICTLSSTGDSTSRPILLSGSPQIRTTSKNKCNSCVPGQIH